MANRPLGGNGGSEYTLSKEHKRLVRPLQKRGNGVCASIPRELQKRLAWNVKDAITYDVIDGCLVLTKIKLPSVPDLRLRVEAQEHS